MIWHRGEIIPDDALRISVFDRTFEHGVGLFETLRTWNSQPTLLDRHNERMQRSAHELGLHLEPSHLPDTRAVGDLIAANRDWLSTGQDARLRLTLSGGLSTASPAESVLWMTASPLPPATRASGVIITQTIEVSDHDLLERHKTLNYWRKRRTQEQASANGSDDVLCLTPAGLVSETCRANIFLVEGRRLSTPSAEGPLLPGVMRGLILERAKLMGFEVAIEPMPMERIATAGEAFLTSSLRGMLPVARLLDRELCTPGPITRELWTHVQSFLESNGRST